MRRSIPFVLLAVLLLTMGVVVGRTTAAGQRTQESGKAPDLLGATRPEPDKPSPAPLLMGAPAGEGRELAQARVTLEALRAERDRLAAELAPLQEQAKRWQGLAELERAQRAGNEIAAVAVSRNAMSALAQVQASAKVDEDGDGVGEFAGFLEMSGGAVGRMASGKPLNPPVLSGAFRTLTKDGEAYRNGYLYRVFLPDARGNGIGEGPQGFLPGQISPDMAETTWCMYAWPAVGGEAGQKTYFTNQAGDVLVTEDPRYAGPGGGPAADAAFRGPGIAGPAAIGVAGNDGNTWSQAN